MDEFDEICRRCTPVVYRFHKIFTRIIFRKMDNDLSLLVQLKSASHKKDNDVL